MGFRHHHVNRISVEKNDSLCNSGGYMATSTNKQRNYYCSVCNICGKIYVTGPLHPKLDSFLGCSFIGIKALFQKTTYMF